MSKLAISCLAEINPPARIPKGVTGGTAVSFIPMTDVSESGRWTLKQSRPLGSVASGLTAFEEGDVLVAKITPCLENGKGGHAVGLENGIGFGSTEFHVLRARLGNDSRFLFHLTQWRSFRRAAERQMVGSAGQQRVPRAFFNEFFVNDFSADQQARIAQILDTLDTAIQETEAIIAKLKAVKQGLMHDLLTRGIDANGELRPPQSEAPQRYKQSPLGWIPKEWMLKTGSDVCAEIVVGIVIRPTQYYRPEGIPVFRSANVRENRLSLSDLVFMSERDHRALSKSAVRPGDVLTVRTGYPGTSCVVDSSVREANCVDILISRPSNMLNATFWSIWINSHLGKSQVLAAQGGLAQQHFNVGDLQKLVISMPMVPEQSEIARRLASAEMRLDGEHKALATLADLKRGLMDDLLTGRVRVTPLLEPAS